MVGESLLECVFCYANVYVGFVGVVYWDDLCVVGEAGCLSVALRGQFSLSLQLQPFVAISAVSALRFLL